MLSFKLKLDRNIIFYFAAFKEKRRRCMLLWDAIIKNIFLCVAALIFLFIFFIKNSQFFIFINSIFVIILAGRGNILATKGRVYYREKPYNEKVN